MERKLLGYPTLEQYNEAFQHPQLALTDPELKSGSIATTGLGLPLALCGGFALTYTITSGTKKYAVRCFHKQSNALETRYQSISARLKRLRSPYFVDFEFQPQGVRVGGRAFPIVKMTWAKGTTLGEFLERNHRNPTNLQNLGSSLRTLATYLKGQGMAHGDIQPGNVMVADAGKTLQLIDYDGIFIDELRALGSSELGHRNFQHPGRSSSCWDSSLDRFSFICLDLSLRALASHPELWARTQSDGDSILFKANDFANPDQSAIFGDLNGKGGYSQHAKNLAAICRSAFEKTPTLEDFLAQRNIPLVAISVVPTKPATYLSAFPVVDATNYTVCLGLVGEKVELIGRIVEVKEDRTRRGKPYVFINFGPWQGHIVKVSIWSEGLAVLSAKPTAEWVGKWINVVGLMEPPYVSRKYKYSHLSISITQGSQLHVITEKEAKFRLSGSSTRASAANKPSNRQILEGLNQSSRPAANGRSRGRATATAPVSSNQAVLKKMQSSQPAAAGSNPSPSPGAYKVPASSSGSNCFIATAIYGPDSLETNTLRAWRERSLMPSRLGRTLVKTYYTISPSLVRVISRHAWIRRMVKQALDRVVRAVSGEDTC